MGDDEEQVDYYQSEQLDLDDFDLLDLSKEQSIIGQEILEMQDIIKVIMKEVYELKEILYFDEDNTFELFMQYNWNKEDIIQKYYSNSEKLLAEFQIKGIINNHSNIIYNGLQGSCSVCLCEEELIQLGCIHRFCQSCIKQTIMQRVQKDKFLVVRCLQNGCDYKLPFSMIKRFSNYNEFDNLLCKRFVECSKSMAFCPATNCNKILKPKFTSIKELTCICQKKFCFCCKEELHPPCPCDLVKKWLQQIKKDEATVNWIMINTKQCPFCKKAVEKSVGCNYMMCKPPGGCGKAFCYVCAQPWEPDHKDHYKCNKYVPLDINIQKQKEIFQRYNFYYLRYLNSQGAKENAEQKLKKIQNEYIHQIFIHLDFNKHDTQFLEEVMRELIQSRIVLKWSYCIGYYISQNNQKSAKLFDHYQELFEYSCECLAIALIRLFDQIEKFQWQTQEGPINEEKNEQIRLFIKNREIIENASQKCQKMRLNLESAIYQGNISM